MMVGDVFTAERPGASFCSYSGLATYKGKRIQDKETSGVPSPGNTVTLSLAYV